MRVKSGRMRNYWFPRGRAEYMTKQRFRDMGLTESAIGVRDRTFGQPRSVLEAMEGGQGQGGQGSARDTNVAAVEAYEQEAREARKRMDSLTMRVCLLFRTLSRAYLSWVGLQSPHLEGAGFSRSRETCDVDHDLLTVLRFGRNSG